MSKVSRAIMAAVFSAGVLTAVTTTVIKSSDKGAKGLPPHLRAYAEPPEGEDETRMVELGWG